VNRAPEVQAGKVTAATNVSGTWFEKFSKDPSHKNEMGFLENSLRAMGASDPDARPRLKVFDPTDSHYSHLAPFLVNRHKRDSIVSSVSMTIEAMLVNWDGDDVSEAEFQSLYARYAPAVLRDLPDLKEYLNGLVNDGILTFALRSELEGALAAQFGGQPPTMAGIRGLRATMEKALRGVRDVRSDSTPYIEFIPVRVPPNPPQLERRRAG
jgi:hypothetical protein